MANSALERPKIVSQSIPYDVIFSPLSPSLPLSSRLHFAPVIWMTHNLGVWVWTQPLPAKINGLQIYFGMQDLRQMIKNVQSFVVPVFNIDWPRTRKWMRTQNCVFTVLHVLCTSGPHHLTETNRCHSLWVCRFVVPLPVGTTFFFVYNAGSEPGILHNM